MNSTAELTRAKTAEKSEPKAELKVTFHPGPEDKSQATVNGVLFVANKPVVMSRKNKRHYFEDDMPQHHVAADGTHTTRTVRTLTFMPDRLKDNPFFEVEGFPRFIKPIAHGRKPQTAEEYRSWAQAWFAAAGTDGSDEQTPREMVNRWDDEKLLRERIGVGEEDIAMLRPFFDMKVEQMNSNLGIKHASNDGGDM
jgi:hypothetical protein